MAPIAVLLAHVLFVNRAETPRAVLFAIFPLPRPIIKVLRERLPSRRTLSLSTLFVLITRSTLSWVQIKLVPATVPELPRVVQLLSIPLALLRSCHRASQLELIATKTCPPVTAPVHRILILPFISTFSVGEFVPNQTSGFV